ncbi:MAG: enoyl-CoA hydratase/isomerase family protein, partial [Acidimicrobiales bacterium]
HDHRVMRSDRGYICWPEVVLGMSFPIPLQELNRVRLPAITLHEAQTTGRRYGGPDAVESGIVHRTVPEADVLATATELARPHESTAGRVLGRIKNELYPDVVAALRDHPHP